MCVAGKEGTGYKWLPEVASRHVHVVHIQLRNDYSSALVAWDTGIEEQVAIAGGPCLLQIVCDCSDTI